MNTKRDCQSCKYYKNGYCENLELEPKHPNDGCDYFDEEKQEQTRDEKMIDAIDFAIKATDLKDDYSVGMRNGMRYVKFLIDGKEPQYEFRRTDEEIKLGIDLGDEVVGDHGEKGVVVGIDTYYKGEILLSLLMRNYKVPQLVNASSYKTKTGRHFPQIMEVLKQIKGEEEAESKSKRYMELAKSYFQVLEAGLAERESDGTHKVRWINGEMTTIDPQIRKDFREKLDNMGELV